MDPNAQKGFGYNDLYEDELIDDDSALKTDYFGSNYALKSAPLFVSFRFARAS